ncbi:MAG: VOC family protein [Pseudomonadota bacterium]
MAQAMDHFVWGVPDFDQGCAEIESLFGVAPEPGGSHPAHGTCNALLSLGTGLYLEIMAPDKPQPGSTGARLAELDAPGLVTWVLRRNDLSALSESVARQTLGVTALGPIETERLTLEGDRLVWELLFLVAHEFGGLVPFFIDWRETTHPAITSLNAGTFKSLELQSPRAAQLNALLTGVGADVLAGEAQQDQLTARFEGKSGEVVLRSTPESLTIITG